MSWSGRSCGVTSGRAIEQVGAAAEGGTGKTVIKKAARRRQKA